MAHVENVEATDFTEQFGLEFYDNRKGLLTISFVSDVPLSGDGIIATLSFVIRDGAIGGITAPLTLVDAQLNDLSGLDLENSVLQTPIYTTNGELTILNVPLLHVSSTNLYYEVSGAPATHGLIVSNSGTGTLRWIASEVADWISLDDASGITPAILNITVQPEGLKGGVYESEVTITNADDLTQVKVIRVWLTVISHELYLSILLKE